MESNFRFHSLIYRAKPMETLNRLIEMMWMQFGPFMRLVHGRIGTAHMVDQHMVAAKAIADRDAARLERAIHDDIGDGMRLIREQGDRTSTRLNPSHSCASRMPSSALQKQ